MYFIRKLTMAKDHLISILDEQISVGFTGKINVLNPVSNQMLGSVSLFEGEVIHTSYNSVDGIKAFFNLCVDEFESVELSYVVEPELINLNNRSIHYPYSVLKRKIAQVIENFRASKENKPPNNLKILIRPEFIGLGEEVSGEEYDLLQTIADYNRVSDIYKNSSLLDYEITNCLVSLRKKNALTVIKNK